MIKVQGSLPYPVYCLGKPIKRKVLLAKVIYDVTTRREGFESKRLSKMILNLTA